MGKFSDELLFGMTIRESATDGSDFTNPAADYRRLFLGEDGQLHVRDSAGTVTDIGSGSGAVATDTIWDAAGDLVQGTGANTGAKLTAGTAGHVLTSNGAAAAVSWQAPTGGITRTTQGTTSAGATFLVRGMYLKKLTLASAAHIGAIHAFIKGDGATVAAFVPVVYSDTAGAPINLIFTGPPNITLTPVRVGTTILNTTVRDLQMSCGVWLPAGDYWFGLWISDGNGTAVYLASTATGGTGATVGGGAVNQPVDSSVSAITTNSVDYSIYIDVLR